MIEKQTKPFKAEEVIAELKKAFPNYIVRSAIGSNSKAVQVRTKKITFRGHASVAFNPEKGKFKVSTHLDMVYLYLLFLLPVAIYIMMKKDDIKAHEKLVVDKVEEIIQQQA